MVRRTSRFRTLPARRATPGTPPGVLDPTLIDADAMPPGVRAFAWAPDALHESAVNRIDELDGLRARFPVIWVDVEHSDHPETLMTLRDHFGIHALVVEDIFNVPQRSKLDDYDDHVFLVVHAPTDETVADVMGVAREGSGGDSVARDGGRGRGGPPERTWSALRSEQISIVLAPGVVLTFQERPGDCFEPVRHRLRAGRGRIRAAGADYVAYALVDAIVDAWFPVVDRMTDTLDQLEDDMLLRKRQDIVEELLRIRHEAIEIRRLVRPLHSALQLWMEQDSRFVSPETVPYLRDLQDHVVRITEAADSARDHAANLIQTHMAVSSQEMNEVMKVLTIISTIFMPLSFIAGVYGMNFDPDASPWNMPELGMRYGYPLTLLVMLAVVGGMFTFFRRRGWL